MMSLLQTLWLWLITPLSGSTVHEISVAASWHARLMVMAWSILLPSGVLIARFYKVTPKQHWPKTLDNTFWWYMHLACQILGLLLGCVGLYLILSVQTHSLNQTGALWHTVCGWVVMSLGIMQAMGGTFRGSKGGPTKTVLRGDHYDMTPYRRIFETLHKSLGYMALVLALCTVSLGLWVSDAPRWMPIIIAAWYLGLLGLGVRLQYLGRCFDTYQAIWGDDAQHPGNTLPAAGWGSKRYSAADFKHTFNQSRNTPKA